MLSESHTDRTSCHIPYLSLSLTLYLSLYLPLSFPISIPTYLSACPWAVTVIVSASGAVTRDTDSIECCTAYCAFPLHKIKAQSPLPPFASSLPLQFPYLYEGGGNNNLFMAFKFAKLSSTVAPLPGLISPDHMLQINHGNYYSIYQFGIYQTAVEHLTIEHLTLNH